MAKDPDIDYEIDSDEEWEEVRYCYLLTIIVQVFLTKIHPSRKSPVKASPIVRRMRMMEVQRNNKRLMMKMKVKMDFSFLMDIYPKMR